MVPREQPWELKNLLAQMSSYLSVFINTSHIRQICAQAWAAEPELEAVQITDRWPQIVSPLPPWWRLLRRVLVNVFTLPAGARASQAPTWWLANLQQRQETPFTCFFSFCLSESFILGWKRMLQGLFEKNKSCLGKISNSIITYLKKM